MSTLSGWRGTNDAGGKVALADWKEIALNGRVVNLAFDSDIVPKTEVRRALKELKEYLESKKATVHIAKFPHPD